VFAGCSLEKVNNSLFLKAYLIVVMDVGNPGVFPE
jgi:hypothetical protein